jgi:sugar phosphate isomerase/epimerase
VGTRTAFAAEREGIFADAPLKISAPPGWFEHAGEEPDEWMAEMARWGLPAYEWLWPRYDPDKLRALMDKHGLELSCMFGAGGFEVGYMVSPSEHDEVVEQFKEAVKLAQRLGCKKLIGITGNERDDVSRDEQTRYVIQCLKKMAPIAEDQDVILVVEALNVQRAGRSRRLFPQHNGSHDRDP